MVYFKQGAYAQAIDDCTKAIELNNLCRDAYYLRAKAYRVQGKVQQAREDLKKVEELGGSPEMVK